jgi:hypothetical protein
LVALRYPSSPRQAGWSRPSGLLFIPSPNDIHVEGEVEGIPGLHYAASKAALLAINAAWHPRYAFAYAYGAHAFLPRRWRPAGNTPRIKRAGLAYRVGSVRVPFRLGSLEAHQVKGVPQVPDDPTFPDDYYIPWIFYLSAPFAAGLKVASEIQTERTPDGGLLMIAAEDRLDPTNPAHGWSAA